YRNKAKFIKKTATKLVEECNGEVSMSRKELESLPGVGRKTANVVRSVAFNEPAIAVDTHVERIAKKFKMVDETASVIQVENTLMEKLPKELRSEERRVGKECRSRLLMYSYIRKNTKGLT